MSFDGLNNVTLAATKGARKQKKKPNEGNGLMSARQKWIYVLMLFALSAALVQADTSRGVVSGSNGLCDEIKTESFSNPSKEFGPKTWWHWFNGNIVKDGMVRDLDDFADKGIVQAQIFHLGWSYPDGPVRFNSPAWYDTFKFTVDEAARRDLKIGIHNCDGWSQSGGPWITPENSMKKLTFYSTRATGNGREQGIKLETPNRIMNFYRDICVLAYPAKRPARLAFDSKLKDIRPVTGYEGPDQNYRNLCDENFGTLLSTDFAANNKSHVGNGYVFEFSGPIDVGSLVVIPSEFPPGKMELSCSDDGINYRKVSEFTVTQDGTKTDFPVQTARFWKLVNLTKNRDLHWRVSIFEIREVEFLEPGEASRSMSLVADLLNKYGAGHPDLTFKDYERSKIDVPQDMILNRSEIVALSEKMDAGGNLTWRVPAGDWVILRAGYTTTGRMVAPATREGEGLEVDKFEPAAVRYHFDRYVKKMIEAAGDKAPDAFNLVGFDSWEAGSQNWSENFPGYFQKYNGYDLVKFMPLFIGECVDSVDVSDRVLWDFRRTIADILTDHYIGTAQSWLNERGLQLEMQAIGTHAFFPDSVSSYRYVDIPMCEIWYANENMMESSERHVEYMVDRGNRETASACHLFGKKIMSVEIFTSGEGSWSATPAKLKRTMDVAFVAGANQLTLHTIAHQPDETYPGWAMNPWGSIFGRKLTWWGMSKPWFDYMRRNQYMLQRGKWSADILLFYGDAVPGVGNLTRNDKQDQYTRIGAGYSYDMVDGRSLRELLEVKDGTIYSPDGDISYKLLSLQKGKEMTLGTLKGVKRLIENGATVCGFKPGWAPSFRGGRQAVEEWNALADEIFGNGDKAERRLGKGMIYVTHSEDEALAAMNVPPQMSFEFIEGSGMILWLKRESEDGRSWYFIVNHEPEPVLINASFRESGKVPQRWDAYAGRTEYVPMYEQNSELSVMPIKLEANESCYIVFDKDQNTAHAVAASADFDFYEPADSVLNGDAVKILKSEDNRLGAEFFENGAVDLTKPDGSVVRLVATDVPSPVTVDGPFAVSFDEKRGGPANATFEKLEDWRLSSNDGIKHYSGVAVYNKEFDLKPGKDLKTYLSFDDVKDVAQVYLNGRYAGTMWHRPFRLDVTEFVKDGKNSLEVKVANTWVNRCLYDATLPEEQRLTWANSFDRHFKYENGRWTGFWKIGPLPSGLIGDLNIVRSKVVMEGVAL